MTALRQLLDEVDVRVGRIRASHPDWLCAKGCDSCCRRLAAVLPLTSAEWDLLRTGLAQLPAAHLAQIRQQVASLAGQPSGPFVCPLLDQASGACPVYAQRPVACRTYGFYVQRDKGLFCHEIESLVDQGHLGEVVWGNHEGVEQQLRPGGEPLPLNEWFALWAQDTSAD
jgi:Fe-S-cluster containining protein